jgi:Spy/CpxP family protein refolding chaperone
MRIARNAVLALAAAGALALGSAALAQDTRKPEAKVESGDCHGAQHGQHQGHGKHERHGKQEKHDHS